MATDGPIDFATLAAALLDRADVLVPRWLPGGTTRGHEYTCADLSGGRGRSLSVNLKTGLWKDFAGDDSGVDLVSLYAAIHGLNQGQAARALMRELGWEKPAVQAPARRSPSSPEEPPPTEPDEVPGRRKSMWRAITPVPKGAPEPDFRHWHYTEVARSWEYRFEGELYGHVVRFTTSDGGKEILPHTWCVDESDGRGTQRWHWKQWDEPRPLYVPATLLSGSPADVPVALVEGEKCALSGHELLGHEFDFVSWPGGSNAWAKASWGWLMGRTVYLWPDCDAKRVKLTRAEREANVDPNSKPLLPEAKQPGMRAMMAIGALLVAEFGCTVFMCDVPKPGAVADGWDLADAIEQGWTADQVRAFIRGARVFEPPQDEARAKAKPTPSLAGAEPEQAVLAWRAKLIETEKHAIKACRENVVLALDGMDLGDGRGWLPGIPEARGLIAFNEFTNDVVKLRPTPWGTAAGVWDEVDELLMGEWLARQHWLPSMTRGTLEEATLMVAKRHPYHPVRRHIEGLRGRWDREKRLRTWLRKCCLEEDEWDDKDPLQQYLARVGTWLLMAMVARVMRPGCKFDYMVIFEGGQGIGKSTLAAVLGGDYYADTGLMLGDKDSYQNLQGVHVYEMGELDSMSKSDITKVKLFISSQKDRFRASFDRRAKDYPRQVIFIGTTNEDHYLVDPTGNRRMWPVRVTRQIDIPWIKENRDQLLAEALTYFEAGERFHPTPKEQRELFDPQQQHRMVENAIESAIAHYLYENEVGLTVQTISTVQLLGKVGIGVEKLGPGRFHEKQAAAALRRLGWAEDGREQRSVDARRPRLYRRPSGSSEVAAGGSQASRPTQGIHQEDPNGCPF